MNIQYKTNTASQKQIESHFSACDALFLDQICQRVKIEEYTVKIFKYAEKVEAWIGSELVGLLAMYENFENSFGFITDVSVVTEHKGKGIASKLLENSIQYANESDLSEIKLEVDEDNIAAISLYRKFGFNDCEIKGSSLFMRRYLKAGQKGV